MGDTATHPCDKITTGDLAKRCNTTLRTIRFYEEAGILVSKERSCGGHRTYVEEDVTKLSLVIDLRDAGMSLAEIKELFEFKDKSVGCAKKASLCFEEKIKSHIASMEQKIKNLIRLKSDLSETLHVMEECRTCDAVEAFPQRCTGCHVLESPSLPRAMSLLWKTAGCNK